MAGAIPSNTPRFTLFAWEHERDGENVDSLGEFFLCEKKEGAFAHNAEGESTTDRLRSQPSITLAIVLKVFSFHGSHIFIPLNPPVFIYTCPPASKIRERMVYSSCRASVVTVVEAEGLTIAKKVHIFPLPFLSLLPCTFSASDALYPHQFETNDPTDLTESYLIEELHPPQSTVPTGSNLDGGTRPLLGQPLPGGFKRPAAPKRKPVT